MGFSAEWLALREPADRAARDADMLTRAVTLAGPDPVVLDLGCGTGSTLRAMADSLPDHARWLLVDHDPALLERAAAEAPGRAQVYRMDLRDLDALPLEGVTLVTASALLDLMPAEWVDRLAEVLARARLPFYAALSYDGIMAWDPAMLQDAEITRAFNDHQRGDKGLGRALGPDAVPHAAQILSDARFTAIQAVSPWALGPQDAALQAALTDGIAQAAAEAGTVDALAWGAARANAAATTRCTIGHLDLLALPPGRT